MPAPSRLAFLLLASGCGGEEGYQLRVHVGEGGRARAARIEVSVLEDCGAVATKGLGQPVDAPIRTVDVGSGEALGHLDPGEYGFYGRAWDHGCGLFAAGCTSASVEAGGAGSIDVLLVREGLAQDACDEGLACVPCAVGTCSGFTCAEVAPTPCGAGPAATGVGWVETPGFAAGVVATAGRAYVVDRSDGDRPSGLRVVDVADPQAPAIVGSQDIEGAEGTPALVGTRVWVAAGFEGLQAVDVDADGSAALGPRGDLPGTPSSVALLDLDTMLVAAGDDPGAGLLRVEVGGAAPAVATWGDTPGDARDVGLLGTLALVADGPSGLSIVSVAGDLATVISTTPVGDAPDSVARGVAGYGTSAFVACESSELVVFDLTTPFAPTEIGRVDVGGRADAVAVFGTRALVAAAGAGVVVVDVSLPATPHVLGTVDTPGEALDVALDGSFAYVADAEGGLQIVDLGCLAP